MLAMLGQQVAQLAVEPGARILALFPLQRLVALALLGL